MVVFFCEVGFNLGRERGGLGVGRVGLVDVGDVGRSIRRRVLEV